MIKRNQSKLVLNLSARKWVILCFSAVVLVSLVSGSLCKAQEMTEREKTREMAKLAKEELNGTVWEVTLKPMATNKNKKLTELADTLRFEDKRVSSDMLVAEGFNASNFTVRVKGAKNERVVWETMQVSEESGVAFWRGEISLVGVI